MDQSPQSLLQTVQEMHDAVQEEWDELEPEDWNESIDSMPNGLKQVKQ